MRLFWAFTVFLCLHWGSGVSSQALPTGTCDCATFARNNVRPKRPLVTWPAGDTACSASSVARCRLECNKFFRTFEFDALDLVCGSLQDATRVQILFGYRICKSKWHSLGLSEEPICCKKSRPIHCDTVDATRRLSYPHNPHGELANKKKVTKKPPTMKIESDNDKPSKEDDDKTNSKKIDIKPEVAEDNSTKKVNKKIENNDSAKKTVNTKPKEEANKEENDEKRITKKSNNETVVEEVEEAEEDTEQAEDEDKPSKKNIKKALQKPGSTRKRQKPLQKHEDEKV